MSEKDLISKKASKAFEKIKDNMAWDRMDKTLTKHKTRLLDEIKKGSSIKRKAGLKKGGRAGYNLGRTVQKTDTSGMPQTPQEVSKRRSEWKRKKLKRRIQVEDLRDEQTPSAGRAKHNIGGRANLLEEMGRIDARRHPDAADRAEKRRVIGELNRGYKSGG